MNTTPQVHAMIVAAGRGSRFGATIAKQYTILNHTTVLQQTLCRLASSHYIESCFLVIAADDSTARNLAFELPIHYVIGGVERWQSVQAGVRAIIDAGANDTDLIVIHDAARPAVPIEDIDRVIAVAMLEPYGAILAAPVADTLKQSQDQPKKDNSSNIGSTGNGVSYIKNTIDRNQIWQAQTPQVFRIGELNRVLNYVAKHQLTITDEASAFEHLDLPIRLIRGSRQNIKLTFPEDTILLAAILSAQSSA